MPNVTLSEDDMTYDFQNLDTALYIRMVTMIIPAFLVFCMIPDTTVIKTSHKGPEDAVIELDDRGTFVPLRDSEEEDEIGFSKDE